MGVGGDLMYVIGADVSGLLNSFKQADHALANLGRGGSKSLSGLQSSISKVGNFAQLMFSGIGSQMGYQLLGTIEQGAQAVAQLGLTYDRSMEQNQIAMESMLQSGDKAKAFLADLYQFAATTPFEFAPLTDSAKKFLAIGMQTKEVIPLMRALGDATSGMGTGQEGIARATYALQQIQMQGRAYGQDMMQLVNAGIPIWDALAAHMGKPTAELKKMNEQGKISSKDIFESIANYDGKAMQRLKGMMDKQSKSIDGYLSTIHDVASSTLGAVFQPLLTSFSNVAPQLISKLTTFGETFRSTLSLSKAFQSIVPKELVPQVQSIFDTIAKSWRGFVNNLTDGQGIKFDGMQMLKDTLNGIQFVVENMKPVVTALGGALRSVGETAAGAVGGFMAAFDAMSGGKTIGDLLADVIRGVTVAFDALRYPLQIAGAILGGFFGLITRYGGLVTATIVGMVTWFTALKTAMLIEDIIMGVSSAMATFGTLGGIIEAGMTGAATATEMFAMASTAAGISMGAVTGGLGIFVAIAAVAAGLAYQNRDAIAEWGGRMGIFGDEVQRSYQQLDDWKRALDQALDAVNKGNMPDMDGFSQGFALAFEKVTASADDTASAAKRATDALEALNLARAAEEGVRKAIPLLKAKKDELKLDRDSAELRLKQAREDEKAALKQGKNSDAYKRAVIERKRAEMDLNRVKNDQKKIDDQLRTAEAQLGEAAQVAKKAWENLPSILKQTADEVGRIKIDNLFNQKASFPSFAGWRAATEAQLRTMSPELSKLFEDMGVDVVTGFEVGMMQDQLGAKTAAATLAASAYRGSADYLEVHSPSQLFMRLGQAVIEGFVNGITNFSGMISGALNAISSQVLGWLASNPLVAKILNGVGISLPSPTAPTAPKQPIVSANNDRVASAKQAAAAPNVSLGASAAKMPTQAAQISNSVLANFRKGMAPLSGLIGMFFTQGLGRITSTGSQMTSRSAATAGNVTARMRSGMAPVPSLISTYWSRGHGHISTIGGAMAATAGGVGSSTAGRLRGGMAPTPSIVASIMAAARARVSGISGSFGSAAAGIGSAVASAIRGGASSIISAAASIGQQAIDAFKAKLHINSPSLVFMEAASSIPEGIAAGIEGGAGLVSKAMAAVVPAANFEGYGGGSAFAMAGNTNIVIHAKVSNDYDVDRLGQRLADRIAWSRREKGIL